MFDDVTVELSDAVDWDAETEVAVGAALESEAPLWPQALSAAAAPITTAAAAAALAGVFMHCPRVIVGRLKEESASGFDLPTASGLS